MRRITPAREDVMDIVDLTEARTFALTLTRSNRSAAGLLIEELADEVEALERSAALLRIELAGVRSRALHVAAHSPHREAASAALRILGRTPTAAPMAARQERAAKLRADAAYWTSVAAEEIDGEKKAMAEELARSLSKWAKEVDL